MGIVYSTGDWTGAYRQAYEAILDAAPMTMEKVVREAVETAKAYTASRPSAKSGKAGRVETGAMMEAIQGEVTGSRTEIIGRFGFIHDHKAYYTLQTTTGFRHNFSGAFIAPTLAIIDAAREAEQNMYAMFGTIVAEG